MTVCTVVEYAITHLKQFLLSTILCWYLIVFISEFTHLNFSFFFFSLFYYNVSLFIMLVADYVNIMNTAQQQMILGTHGWLWRLCSPHLTRML